MANRSLSILSYLFKFSSYMSPRFWALSFYCICYNPTALGGYNTQSKAKKDWQVKAAVRVLTSNIDNAHEILSKIKKLCPVDVPCQYNADLDGTRPERALPARVGNLLWSIFFWFFCSWFVNFGAPFRTIVPLHLLQSHCSRGQREIWALSFYCTYPFFLWCETHLNYWTKRMASTQLTT